MAPLLGPRRRSDQEITFTVTHLLLAERNPLTCKGSRAITRTADNLMSDESF